MAEDVASLETDSGRGMNQVPCVPIPRGRVSQFSGVFAELRLCKLLLYMVVTRLTTVESPIEQDHICDSRVVNGLNAYYHSELEG